MCKQILGVQKQTTNIGVLLEIERTPLSIFAAEVLIEAYKEGAVSWDSSFIFKRIYQRLIIFRKLVLELLRKIPVS